jgi:hypothetical protein
MSLLRAGAFGSFLLLGLASCGRREEPRAIAEHYDATPPTQTAAAPVASTSASASASTSASTIAVAPIPEPILEPPEPPKLPPKAILSPPITSADDFPIGFGEQPLYETGAEQKASPGGVGKPLGGQPMPVPAGTSTATPPKPPPGLCKDVAFPPGAEEDEASVTTIVEVDASGHPTKVSIASESPAGQGFGAVARACLLGATFTPAHDDKGVSVSGNVTVRVRFAR